MNRTQFMRICNECNNNKALIRERLNEYFDTQEGREALARAPQCLLYDSKAEGKETTKELAIELLLQEVREDGTQY